VTREPVEIVDTGVGAAGVIAQDPFGLRDLDVDTLRRRPGAKWHRPGGRLAAWVADMDFPVAPCISDRLVELATTDLGYPDWERAAASPLPSLFADRMQRRYGWRPQLDRLHELNDVVQGVRLAIHHLTGPGDRIVLHTPAYTPFLRAIEEMGRRIVRVPWPFDHEQLDRALDAEPARLLLLCHPHNPTGHVFDRRELERIAAMAHRHDLVVVSDEIHADLTHAPHTHVPFESLGHEVSARSVTVTSASKTFNIAGLRWAVLHAGHDGLHHVLQALGEHYFGAPNLMAVAATEQAWTSGGEWLEAVLAVIDENRHLMGDLLAEHLPGAVYEMPDATYLAWVDCRASGLGDDPAAVFAERGVEVSPGPNFGVEGLGHVRINLATSPSVLRRIVATMGGG
jgi:cysteine-S-conjugate beta-lyase